MIESLVELTVKLASLWKIKQNRGQLVSLAKKKQKRGQLFDVDVDRLNIGDHHTCRPRPRSYKNKNKEDKSTKCLFALISTKVGI